MFVPKDNPAAELAKKRWDKTTAEERSEIARGLNEAKYADMSQADRKEIGRKLAEARATAKKRRGPKKVAGSVRKRD